MKKKPLIITAIAAAVITGGYFFVRDSGAQTTYLTEEVKRGNIEKNVVATGSIESINTVDVGAQVSGKVTKLYVKLGQQVKKGDLIAEIDSTTQINTLNTRKAALTSYQAQLVARKTAYDVALSNYNRLSKLYGQKATSLDTLNTAKATLNNAKAEMDVVQENIKQAEIEVNTAETNVGYTKITSPIDGTVISTPVSEGQTVNSNQTTPTIIKVADLSKMRIKPEISEGDITKVKAGQDVTFTILSDNKTVYHAKIDSVDPATTTISDNSSSNSSSSGSGSSSGSSSSAVYYYANIIVENPEHVLRIGMTTENNIKIADVQNVLFIPNLAVQKQQDKYVVNVLNGNTTQEREIEIGVQNDFQTEVKSGLTEGEKVVISQVAAGETFGDPDAPIIF
ncbi:efflux transporter periplasmic adaptor subunit [Aggregatibacter actinomycetemcomitans]|uniref:ABC transporter substrate-binding protein n=1 Tax=Aggregatibacter actinomycetemcomitans TaxID=714 RepID=A0A5D0EIR6_AGGAC|nr:efflux RND transporter periplasmic adaptor subunit [Aggregatibacter actinomycetemcomitans]AFI88057.1 ABC transporter substrate-binding protein [Aggregatibacter actinomycetemcomitans D7S-1]KYK93140.1 ABC transporter substrate-binding protein [Aggregatibacter actinomycetemcomitans serotype d str. SA3733]AMQ94984.1 ABC transporter substrate-binding protein [Aggregatibacter actinomycetemcomitans]ANU82483.1 efflux transporter periplasmic adaptor subunit [Aggregatibacter actinomycetemcomitans]EKX